MKEKKIVMFDLDGTLVDSAREIYLVINKMRARYGLSCIDFTSTRHLAGLNAFNIVQQIFPDLDDADGLVQEFRQIYLETTTSRESCFHGVHDCLAELKDNGLELVLITNKPENLRNKVLVDTSLDSFFSYALSPGSFLKAKPAPDMLNKTLSDFNIDVSNAVFVGDSYLDYEACTAARVNFIGFCQGYDPKITELANINKFDRYEDLVTIVNSNF